MTSAPTLAEVVALLSLAQDLVLGQPPGAQLRAAVIAQRLAEQVGVPEDERETVWWSSTLRYLGCTGHAFDMAVVFGDEIEMRAETAGIDFASPVETMSAMMHHAASGKSGVNRMKSVLSIIAGGKKAAEMNFRTACEVAEMFAKRLGLDEGVLVCLRNSFERWNGRGVPAGVKGAAIPRPMRIAQLSQEAEILARIEGADQAIEVIRRRAGGSYDPELARAAVDGLRRWWEAIETLDPWDAALAVAPTSEPLDDESVRDCFLVLADFADLKSPWFGGHSRQVADLVEQVCGPSAGLAALVHDLGRVAVPNSIWDKPGPLTRDESDRVETHSLVTDQLLRRLPFTRELAETASAAHERLDKSGYHRRVGASHLEHGHKVMAAADCYQAMVSDRPYRPRFRPDDAAVELRRMGADGRLDGTAVELVLSAAGHRRRARVSLPAGLTQREVEVLQLLALGLTTRQMAERLVISAKTTDHHIQHIYSKIGVSTRGAAALYAIEQGILASDR